MNIAILVDEINAMHQLHAMGVLGIRPWRAFYEAVSSLFEMEYGDVNSRYHFYGAIPPKEVDEQKFYDRTRFFCALKKDGIYVRKGICQPGPSGRLQEKGVDVLAALDIVELAKDNMLCVFSGDADLVPAIQRARKQTKVVAILKEDWPARYMRSNVDEVLPLERIIEKIEKSNLVPLTTVEQKAV